MVRGRVEVRAAGEWRVEVLGVGVDEQPLLAYRCEILMDTGSNLLILPPALFGPLVQQIDAALQRLSCRRQQLLAYRCPFSPPSLPTSLFLQLSPQSHLRIPLSELAEPSSVSLRIRESESEQGAVGVGVLRDYLVEFGLEGQVGIFESRRGELEGMERANLRTSVALYLLAVGVVAAVGDKLHQLVEGAINRRIVI